MMRPVDLSKLIEGLLVVILLAIVAGKFHELSAVAIREGHRALTAAQPTPNFFND